MPCDYSKYPKNWKKEIRPAILARDGNKCKKCGVENYEHGYWGKLDKFYSVTEIMNALEDNGHDMFEEGNELDHIPMNKPPVKIVLTIAHLDHDTNNNNYDNLAALCQKHHLQHDLNLHRENARETNRKKKGLQKLF